LFKEYTKRLPCQTAPTR